MIRILAVDDDPRFRGFLKEILSAEPNIEIIGEVAIAVGAK